MSFTKIKDLDREILKRIPDEKLLKVCFVSKRMYYDVCDDQFLKRRIEKYGLIGRVISKKLFSDIIKYKKILKEKFQFTYTEGDIIKQYSLISNVHFQKDKAELFFASCKDGDLSLVKYCLDSGVDIHSERDLAVRCACDDNQLHVLRYLVEHGANIHQYDEYSLHWASRKGKISIVKYLLEQGADIHASNDASLSYACEYGHLDIVKYLIEKGADIHAFKDGLLKVSTGDVLQYLRNLYKIENDPNKK